MAEGSDLQDFVDGADVDSAVFTLRPDYRVLLLAVDGLAPGAGDASSEALLRQAEQAPNPSTRWLTGKQPSSIPTQARSCGATTPT